MFSPLYIRGEKRKWTNFIFLIIILRQLYHIISPAESKQQSDMLLPQIYIKKRVFHPIIIIPQSKKVVKLKPTYFLRPHIYKEESKARSNFVFPAELLEKNIFSIYTSTSPIYSKASVPPIYRARASVLPIYNRARWSGPKALETLAWTVVVVGQIQSLAISSAFSYI